LGPRTFGRKEEMVFLGREISEQRNYSEKVAEEIDEEVRQIIDRAYHAAKKLIADHRDRLDTVVKSLLEEETIEGDALSAVLSGGDVPPRPSSGGDVSPPAEESAEPQQKPAPQPKPGLAWDTPARLDPEA
jgi:cell division protease FtsH